MHLVGQVPFSLGFQKLYVTDGEQCPFDTSGFMGAHLYVTRVVDFVVDLIFWADIVFNFISARWVLNVSLEKSASLHARAH